MGDIGGQYYLHLNYYRPYDSYIIFCIQYVCTLFIIHINDLPEISKQAKIIFFTDDANIIVNFNNIYELQAKLSSLQSLLDNWVRKNGLKLNIN